MNINLVCVARTASARERLPRLMDAAVEDAQSVFGEAEDHRWSDGRVALFNADRMHGAWTVPTWHEDGGDIFAVSQPPVPVDDHCDPETYWPDVAGKVRHGDLKSFLPNHFGVHRRPDGSVRVWADTLGLGRCYYVENDDFVAASNHIGVLAHFLGEEVRVDVAAVSRYVHAGWFTLDDSPYVGIRRLRESCCLDIGADGSVTHREHTDLTELVGARRSMPNYDAVVEQTRTIAHNLDALSVRTSTVYLSGGRDSRMTASVWLSGGGSAKVMTLGTLEAEAEIATELIGAFAGSEQEGQEVEHNVIIPKPSSITMSLEERFRNAFAMWDGDAAPTNIKSNVRIPGGRGGLSIGGVGGEIMHGYYYHRDGDLERLAKEPHPVAYAARSFRGAVVTEQAAGAMEGFFDLNYERAVRHGRPDIASLDYLYLTEKFRRWGNQALGSMAAIMLSGPAYVRACFDLTPQDRIDKIFPDQIVRRAIPEWTEIPYYKAVVTDSRRSMKRKLGTYDTDPDYVAAVLENPRRWPEFFREEKIREFLETARGDQGLPVHESWINRAMWVDHLESHADSLNRRVREVAA